MRSIESNFKLQIQKSLRAVLSISKYLGISFSRKLCVLRSFIPRLIDTIKSLWRSYLLSFFLILFPSCLIYLFFLFVFFSATSAVILKTENEHHHLSSLSGDNGLGGGGGVRIGRGESALANGNGQAMDSAQSAMMKQADYVVGRWTSLLHVYKK